jgi:hypothetical protein
VIAGQHGPKGLMARGKREVIDVDEPKKEDNGLGQLIAVRKQRIDRIELEVVKARQEWRAARKALHDVKLRWRSAVKEADDFWREARADFFRMNTTSGEFRRAKGTYERMKGQASKLKLESQEAVVPCREQRTAYFSARERLVTVKRQYEKLGILRDELALASKLQEQMA